MFSLRLIAAGGVALCMLGTPAMAAQCGNGPAGFPAWLAAFKQEAVAAGISPRVASSALDGLTYDAKVISLDRNQRVFKQSFEQFSGRMVNSHRINKGRAMMKAHAGLLSRIEKSFGVPGAVVVAIWALETDFGVNRGNMPVFRSLATLSYDCRRSAFFTDNLMGALKVVQRGDLSPAQMRGAWAGELGQTQFMALNYYKYAVDFDGNGHRDLLRSVPDVLASTANYLKGHGWQRGGGWQPGQANFGALLQWNKSQVYAKTMALLATRLQGN
ncbi:MAG: lytic transglycosylase domain-containing protein [Parvibaculaceae bacterium]